jgi:cell division protein FtsB
MSVSDTGRYCLYDDVVQLLEQTEGLLDQYEKLVSENNKLKKEVEVLKYLNDIEQGGKEWMEPII